MTDTSEDNVLSGNSTANVLLDGKGTDGNVVAGDFIGTTVSGDILPAFNTKYTKNAGIYNDYILTSTGVVIQGGASNNTVGGTSPYSYDVISGNGQGGVVITGVGTGDNVVEGDLIGTAAGGYTALPNGASRGTAAEESGVVIQAGATGNTVGGTSALAADVISGNDGDGVVITGAGTNANLVEGDLIGTSVSGDDEAVPNGGVYGYYVTYGLSGMGVVIQGDAAANTVGGSSAGAGNVISGNYADGVWLTSGALANQVEGNDIGTAPDDQGSMANGGSGVVIDAGSGDNTIGGAVAAAGNVIADNGARASTSRRMRPPAT